MRKMFSENQIKNIVNQGIESGEIDIEEPLSEFPLSVDEGDDQYQLVIQYEDSNYMYITEDSDIFNILVKIIGKYLYCYNSGGYVIAKGIITNCDNDNGQAHTLIPSSIYSNAHHFKIFNK